VPEFSDYIVFVDESGDHNLETMNPDYPIFVLAFCVFRKSDYIRGITPAVQDFKFRWFGHDNVVLHEREILRDMGAFSFLKARALKETFMDQLSSIIDAAPMTIIPTIIRKPNLRERYVDPHNPYHLSLLFCMERLDNFLKVNGQEGRTTHVIFEQRGGKAKGGEEDRLLELEFRRISDGQHPMGAGRIEGLEIEIVSKATNSIGLQIANLVARPIGMKCLRPSQQPSL
jgi:Protein of unknown function (DUF3800)